MSYKKHTKADTVTVCIMKIAVALKKIKVLKVLTCVKLVYFKLETESGLSELIKKV